MPAKRIPVIVIVIAVAAALVATSSFSAASKSHQGQDDFALRRWTEMPETGIYSWHCRWSLPA